MMRSMPENNGARANARLRTATNRTASQVNITVILEELRSSGAQPLSELAQRTGLSTATVNRLVERLIDDGLVLEAGQVASTGGRPARLVEFNARARSVLALDIGGRKIAGAVADLEARMLIRRERPIAASEPGSAALHFFDALVATARELVDEAAARRSPVHAVAVGVPGVVRKDTGRVEFAPSLQWFDLPLAALLEERLGLPVSVENDVNLLALAELRHGAARRHRDVLTIAVGTGVGASLILDGRLYEGGVGAAGEIGYTLLSRSSLATPWPGFGDLESRVGSAGILSRMPGGGAPDPQGLGTETFLDRVRTGDSAAVAVFDEVVDDLALAIGNASVLLNPELVVLGGGFGRAAADMLLPAIERRLQGRIPFAPPFVRAQLEDAELIGAAELAIDSSAESATLAD